MRASFFPKMPKINNTCKKTFSLATLCQAELMSFKMRENSNSFKFFQFLLIIAKNLEIPEAWNSGGGLEPPQSPL